MKQSSLNLDSLSRIKKLDSNARLFWLDGNNDDNSSDNNNNSRGNSVNNSKVNFNSKGNCYNDDNNSTMMATTKIKLPKNRFSSKRKIQAEQNFMKRRKDLKKP